MESDLFENKSKKLREKPRKTNTGTLTIYHMNSRRIEKKQLKAIIFFKRRKKFWGETWVYRAKYPECQAETLKRHRPSHIPTSCLNSKNKEKQEKMLWLQNKIEKDSLERKKALSVLNIFSVTLNMSELKGKSFHSSGGSSEPGTLHGSELQ